MVHEDGAIAYQEQNQECEFSSILIFVKYAQFKLYPFMFCIHVIINKWNLYQNIIKYIP